MNELTWSETDDGSQREEWNERDLKSYYNFSAMELNWLKLVFPPPPVLTAPAHTAECEMSREEMENIEISEPHQYFFSVDVNFACD